MVMRKKNREKEQIINDGPHPHSFYLRGPGREISNFQQFNKI